MIKIRKKKKGGKRKYICWGGGGGGARVITHPNHSNVFQAFLMENLNFLGPSRGGTFGGGGGGNLVVKISWVDLIIPRELGSHLANTRD